MNRSDFRLKFETTFDDFEMKFGYFRRNFGQVIKARSSVQATAQAVSLPDCPDSSPLAPEFVGRISLSLN